MSDIPPIKVLLPEKRGKGKINKTPEEREAMGRAMQLRVIMGRKHKEIAAEFNVPRQEVSRRLKEARESGGILDLAQDIVAKRLLPKAVAVMDAALDGEEVPKNTLDVARDVLFGTNTLKKKDESTVNVTVSPLDAYRKERMDRLQMENVIDIDAVEPLRLTESTDE